MLQDGHLRTRKRWGKGRNFSCFILEMIRKTDEHLLHKVGLSSALLPKFCGGFKGSGVGLYLQVVHSLPGKDL